MTSRFPDEDGTGNYIETLLSAAEGKGIQETAEDWGVSTRCVMYRRKAAIKWLGARNMCHAVYLATSRGILH